MSNNILDNGHWDYTRLLCYQKAVVIYDLTFHFCNRFIAKSDRTFDQMIQAARSGKQNIVEGYTDATTSFEIAIKLYNIARGSLKELLEDYRDYMRARHLVEWDMTSREVNAMREIGRKHTDSKYYIELAENRNDEVIANMAIVLLHQEDMLLQKFIESEVERFTEEGGFREKMTHLRLERRDKR